MLKLKLIVGSTRAGRNADKVLQWAVPVIKQHQAFELEVLDLRDWALPFFQETHETLGDPKAPTYSMPVVKEWNQRIGTGDAFLMLTPEYNHGYPAVLKNAIDSVFFSFGFRNKPVAFIGYSIGVAAGVRAIEQLNQVMIEAEASPIRTPLLIPQVMGAFGPNGAPTNPITAMTMGIMLDDLAWAGQALKAARTQGQLPPATARLRAAMAAMTPKPT